ncbi:hypothetical protein GCM10009841_06040 [Microlunatus panaciterrae]
MNPLRPVWRCRVCEGVNRNGRVCATCGAEVPVGEPLRAAVRTVTPGSTRPTAPPPVPPDPTRHELRTYPVPEEIHPVDSDDRLDFDSGFEIRPLPGGCMINFGPRNRSY